MANFAPTRAGRGFLFADLPLLPDRLIVVPFGRRSRMGWSDIATNLLAAISLSRPFFIWKIAVR
jgi:hypothetical protein